MAIINGTSTADNLIGGLEDDSIDGLAGDDTINGGAGNDTLTGGVGNDTIDGSTGEDTIVFNYPTTNISSLSGVSGVFTGGSLTVIGEEGIDTLLNFEFLQFSDQTVAVSEVIIGTVNDEALSGTTAADLISAGQGNDNINAGAGYDRIWGGSGINTIDGGSGIDTLVLEYASSQISAITTISEQLAIVSDNSTDIISNVEFLKFNDQLIEVDDLVLGTASAQTINGTSTNDVIAPGSGADTINAGAGDDLVLGAEDGETIDGGDGTDTVKFNFSSAELTGATYLVNGDVQLTTEQPTILLKSIENIAFTNTEQSALSDLVAELNVGQTFYRMPNENGSAFTVLPEVYVGPVSYLEYQLFGDAEGNVIIGSDENDFLSLFGDDDAADGGAGQDILDGGTGSNFLIGGTGADTFYLDGRGGEVTWSTIVDFTEEDTVNIWGWVDGTSRLHRVEQSNGAVDYEGVTYHYDLDGNNQIDTSITFTGLAESELADAQALTIPSADLGYLLFA